MKRGKLAILTAFFIFASQVESQGWITPGHPDHPICRTQFGIVNNACAGVQIHNVPIPPPSPPPPPPPPPANQTSSSHRRRRSHNRRRRHHATPAEEECCRWLNQVDNQCVCELLVHLPIFLSRPLHQFAIDVNDACRNDCRDRQEQTEPEEMSMHARPPLQRVIIECKCCCQDCYRNITDVIYMTRSQGIKSVRWDVEKHQIELLGSIDLDKLTRNLKKYNCSLKLSEKHQAPPPSPYSHTPPPPPCSATYCPPPTKYSLQETPPPPHPPPHHSHSYCNSHNNPAPPKYHCTTLSHRPPPEHAAPAKLDHSQPIPHNINKINFVVDKLANVKKLNHIDFVKKQKVRFAYKTGTTNLAPDNHSCQSYSSYVTLNRASDSAALPPQPRHHHSPLSEEDIYACSIM